jgi:1,4-alpha-glucan branching enzyme
MIDRRPNKQGTKTKVTFSIPREWLDQPVSVVGDFNDWDPLANPMRKHGGVRRASVVLETGRTYRFRYLDDAGRWHDDPAADAQAESASGGTDCIIDLAAPAPRD